MRILYLTAQLPEPPHAGGALRTNGLMRGAHEAGHEIHLLSFTDNPIADDSRAALDSFCAAVETVPAPQRSLQARLKALFLSGQADMQQRYASPLYQDRLKAILASTPFDILQIESLEMAAYLPIIKQVQPETPLIYDSFNAEYELQHTIYKAEWGDLRRLPGAIYSWIQWRRLTHFERRVCQTVDHIIAVSEADAEAFKQLNTGTPISVVPNGINTALYSEPDNSLNLGEHALVFTGSMAYRPNVDAALWFAEEILARIREQVPEARFFVVGSQPHARLDVLRNRADIEITGWVPDVNPFLHAAAVYVVPLRMGSGTRLKLLQAMAAGKAVVSTRIGAQGIDVSDGDQLRLADTADSFAQKVTTLLKSPQQRSELGANAARHVNAHYDWTRIVPCLLQVYDRLNTNRQNQTQA